jgi:uncharacterized protein YbjQ (UPF0145 family)
MILVNTDNITNKRIISILGIAQGSTVCAYSLGQETIVDGEISEYTQLQTKSREKALKRMQENAKLLGANAIVNVRFSASMLMEGCSEILAYGTAVKVD